MSEQYNDEDQSTDAYDAQPLGSKVAALTTIRGYEAGVIAAVEALLREAEDEAEYGDVEPETQRIDYADLRTVLTDTGAADVVRRIREEAWDEGFDAVQDHYERVGENECAFGRINPYAGDSA